jgi:thioredoxin reductase (NADPH)
MEDRAVPDTRIRDVIIVGGGLAGMSAAIYLGRALRDALLIDSDHSMAVWESDVQNYLGFPDGIAGRELLERARRQVERFGTERVVDQIESARGHVGQFEVTGQGGRHYQARRLLLATGIYHLPPNVPDPSACIGRSLFFCKDCDAYRVQGQRIAILGHNDDAAEYALAMLAYASSVVVATDGQPPRWQPRFDALLEEYSVPVERAAITAFEHANGYVQSLRHADGTATLVDCVFTTRGDRYHAALARELGADTDASGQVIVDHWMRTSVPGLYAAGCVTIANCQMIIAAGDGATAAQAISRSLFEESLANHTLPLHAPRRLAA